MRRSTILLLSLMNAHPALAMENPCHGPGQLLNIVDRPNNADSACSVPAGRFEFEMGYQNQTLRDPSGNQQNYPSAEFRFGLPHNSEIFLLAPNYIQQSIAPTAGFTQTSGGLKHQLWYNNTWLVTIEGLVNLPDGSAAFGNKHIGEAFNAIISYNINSRLNLTLMAGGSSITESRLDGGQRFYSLNPDLVLTWSLNDKSSVYAEVYGQSKTGYGEGSGFNADVGILYLIRPNVALDFSGSQHLSGYPGGFEHYIGAGLSVMI
ncbi:transporter [Legionella sp. CNM-4043-24]|uniref:transporter n=1 Tax=Legionella sp. CNM-4043-24 TaxID=3421646 RepID=UPI00403AAE87